MELTAGWQGGAGLLLLLIVLAAAEAIAPLRPFHESARRLTTNFGFGLVNFGLTSLLPLSSLFAASWAREAGVGLFNAVAIPPLLLVLVTLAARSLLAYCLHRLFHLMPLLWRVHRVHHTDPAVDLSTGFRSHPAEILIVAAAAAALAAGLGLSPGALLAYEIAATAVFIASHANLRLPDAVDRPLRALLVTPAMHYVHHSCRRPQTDSNFGELFSVWDHLFGTHVQLAQRDLRALRAGLGDASDAGAASFPGQMLLPFRRGHASGLADEGPLSQG